MEKFNPFKGSMEEAPKGFFTISIGDVGGDGHNIQADYTIFWPDAPVGDIRDEFIQLLKVADAKLGVEFLELCSEYEDSSFPMDLLDQLTEAMREMGQEEYANTRLAVDTCSLDEDGRTVSMDGNQWIYWMLCHACVGAGKFIRFRTIPTPYVDGGGYGLYQ